MSSIARDSPLRPLEDKRPYYLWRVGGWTAAAEFLGFSAYAAVETTDAAALRLLAILIR